MLHESDIMHGARSLHHAGFNAREIVESQDGAKVRRVVGSSVKVSGIKLYRRLHVTSQGIAKLTLFGKYKIVDDYALGLRSSPTVIEQAHLALIHHLESHLKYSAD